MMPQSMFVWPGLELIGCPRGSGKQKVVQGVVYTVTDMDEQGIALKMLEDYCHGQKDEEAKVPWPNVCTQLRLCHTACATTPVKGEPSKTATFCCSTQPTSTLAFVL